MPEETNSPSPPRGSPNLRASSPDIHAAMEGGDNPRGEAETSPNRRKTTTW